MLKHIHNREQFQMLKENAGMVVYTQEDFNKAEKRISVCMAVIQTNNPFFSVLIKKLLIIPNIFIPTMATDGAAILYNPKFTNMITEGETIFVLEHEILHCALKHFARMDNRDPQLWNEATDYAINFMLSEMYKSGNSYGAKLLNGCLYDEKYGEMKAEDIYDLLLKQGGGKKSNMMQGQPGQGECPSCGGSGEEQDSQDSQDSNQQGQDSKDKKEGEDQNQQGGDNGEGQSGSDKQSQDGQSGSQSDSQSGQQGHGQGQGQGQHSPGGSKPCSCCSGTGKSPSGGQTGDKGVNPGDGWNVGGVTTPDQLRKYYTDPDNPGNVPNKNSLDKEWEIAVKKAMKQAGNMPGSVKRMIGDVLEPVINWKSQLKSFINALAKKSDYKLPNRRHIHSGTYIPGLKRSMNAIQNIVVAIDTSGSIDDTMLQRYLSEVYDILKTFNPEITYVLYIDTKVQSVDVIKKGGKPDPSKSKGGGGTEFKPAFDWADKNLKPKDISVMLYFTDLYGDTSFPKPKYYNKVIWVLEKNSRDLQIPWGKKLVIDENFKIKK